MSEELIEEIIEHVRSLPISREEKIRVLEAIAREHGIEVTEEHKRRVLE